MNKTTTKKLFQAIEVNDRQVIDEILDEHQDALKVVGFHNRLVRDKTPLMFAMQCVNTELAGYFLDRGADASAIMPGGPKSSTLAVCMTFAHAGMTPFDDWIQLTNRLLDQGADPSTAIWAAIASYRGRTKRIDLIELLYRRGADIDGPFLESGTSVRELVKINKDKQLPELLALFDIDSE